MRQSQHRKGTNRLATELKDKLQNRAVPGKKAPDRATSIAGYLERMKPQIQLALPKSMTADRIARIALTNIRTNPKLLECSVESLMGAVMLSAQLGLEPGPLGHAYLVPYKTECTLIIGYRGMIDLARRSDQILSIAAHVVHENDEFEFTYGLEEDLVHKPAWRNPGVPVGAYMVAKLKDGGHVIEVMSAEEIEAVRARSKAANNGPWVTDWEQMARKTVVRRGSKYLPLSIESQRALAQDETVKKAIEPDMQDVIDVSAVSVPDIDLGHMPEDKTPPEDGKEGAPSAEEPKLW